MKISSNMNLYALAEYMGDCATVEDARAMRDILIERHDGDDMMRIRDDAFLEMMDEAMTLVHGGRQ